MRPTFMGFETATRGLMVNQKALDIVANNTTNIGVTGYTRQRVDLVSLNINMRTSRIGNSSVPHAGQGAAAYGVSQIRDPFLDKRFREEFTDVSFYNTQSSILSDLHAALDEISPSTMSVAMDNFKTAWNELLQKSSETTNAANLLANANKIVSIFQQMSAKVDNVWYQQEYNLNTEVDKVNSILQRIAVLNDTIAKENFNSMQVNNELYKPLELLDQRNVLLDELSGYGDITYREEKDGTVTVMMGGHKAVKGDQAQKLNMRTDHTNEKFPTVEVTWNDTGKPVSFMSGSIRAATDMLNGAGIHVGSAPGQGVERGIHYFKEKLDEFARTFASSFNSVIEIADASGNSYTPARYKTLFTFDNDSSENAASISISKEWAAQTDYILTDVKDKISEGSESNSFAAKAYNLFQKDLNFGEFTGTINDYISFYSVTKLGSDKDFSDTRLKAVSSISDDLLDQIQQTSGVSLDEEGVEMMMYQKAYQAVSRVFTALDEMLEKLINGTGVVGR